MTKTYHGESHIEFSYRNGRYISDKVYNTGNSKVSSLIELDHEDIPCHFLIGMGGGLVEGEQYLLEIKVNENSRGIVSSQAPTYVYKCDRDLVTRQTSRIAIASGGILEYILDAVIPYKDSLFEQEVTIDMAPDATLIYSDGITSGWSPDQKRFQYKSAKMKTQIVMNDTLVCSDFVYLNPREADLRDMGYLEGYNNYGSMLLIDERIDAAFLTELRTVVDQEKDADIEWGASLLEIPGIAIRLLGNSEQAIQKLVTSIANYARKELLDSNELVLRKNSY